MQFLYFVFVILPVFLWFTYFLSKDHCDPGPKRLMLTIFILGIGLAFFAAGIELIIDRFLLTIDSGVFRTFLTNGVATFPLVLSFFNAAVVEELLKYSALKTFFYERVQFNQIADGMFYGVTLALGFSFVENTSYFIGLSSLLPFNQFFSTIVTRAIFTVWLHVTTGATLGYFLGKRKFSPDPNKKYLLSLLWVITLHAFFNTFGVIVSLVMLLPTFAFLIYQFRKPEVTKIWKLVQVLDET